MAVLTFQLALENETPMVLERKDTQILSQHLGKAFEINRFCNLLRQKYQAVLGVLDHMNVGLCVAMESGKLLKYNAKARQIFNHQNGFKLDRYGHIEATDHQKTIQLKNTINACCKTASGKNMAVEYSFQIKKRTDMEPYLLKYPLCGTVRARSQTDFSAQWYLSLILTSHRSYRLNRSKHCSN